MEKIIMKLIRKENITDSDIEAALYDICDTEHASCSSECPVYKKFYEEINRYHECACFKSGSMMLKALRTGILDF